ncbi:Fc receptor-like protein 5 [Xenopus tropicalis]|uniref:Fc receptor-like protein 5 n=1 Tax=Xenopus tropicalis TaxID=8364 RepID=A0A8J0SDB9_XENTR|nr:Fc receptor-like protein 5 [Xenopus tropicalis]|eukprot:XP_012809720.1 PREDICTED: Fc receptor-like protein 5 [Xenopus tropicalis]
MSQFPIYFPIVSFSLLHQPPICISIYPVQLPVSEDKVILQAPPGAHEGEELTLRCYTRPEHKTTNTTVFYRNNSIIRPLGSDSLVLGGAQTNMSGPYSCQTKLHDKSQGVSNPYTSAEEHLSVTELFSSPQIKVSSDQVREGDHMTITCDTELSPHRETTELQFAFYRNGHNVQGFSLSNQYGVPSAQLEDSGNYTCEVQTPTGSVRKRSREEHIQIQELFSTPQIRVSAYQVTEGDHMTITCDTKLRPHRETTELQFAFYRNGHNVQGFNSSKQYGVPSAQLEDSGNYTCEVQTPTGSIKKNSNVTHIRIQELFSAPQIKVSPDQMTEGDHMTITCDTKLSPHRETTELQFAFYRNETKVQEFSRFYEYKILSFALNYSGNYTCEVQALNGRVRKRSGVFRIYQNHEHNNDKDTIPLMLIIGGAVALVVLLSLLIVALCILKSKHKQHRTQSSRRATLSEPGETNLEEEVCYISINFNRQPKGHSAAQNNDDGNNVIYAAVRGNDTGNAQAGYKQAQRENSVVYAALKTPERNKNNRERRNIPQDENCVYALVKKR